MLALSERILEESNLLSYRDFDGTYDPAYGPAELEAVGTTFVEGPIPGTEALAADGEGSYAKLLIDLTLGTIGTKAVAVERFLKWDGFANNDALEFEYGTNYNATGGFLSDPNAAGGGWELALRGSSGPVADSFVRPGAALWLHLVTVFDVGAAAILHYLNGELVELTSLATNTPSGFNNNDLYMFSRAGSSLFGAGAVAHQAIYAGALSAERVAIHYAAASEVPVSFSVFLSGGASNALPANSLGGEQSSEGVGPDLLDTVSHEEAEAGDTEYRCVYVSVDEGATADAVAYLQTPLEGSASLAIGAAVEPAGEEVAAVADEGEAPEGVEFESPESKEDAIDLGTIGPGESKGLWLRREIDAKAGPDFSVPWFVALDGSPTP